ncbi:hypothetical protein BWD14_18010 [Leptospira santarosai]|uniref:Uncharacterized protein n=1 Tax=Leptospira santarosai TaxID=28183 RepID=A0AB73LKM5_9LEPT|nr:hypothetical protein BWD14_18010 [Leptospira santarosai]
MILVFCAFFWFHFHRLLRAFWMLSGDFVFDISLLQTILFALFAIMTLFQGRLLTQPLSAYHWINYRFLFAENI